MRHEPIDAGVTSTALPITRNTRHCPVAVASLVTAAMAAYTPGVLAADVPIFSDTTMTFDAPSDFYRVFNGATLQTNGFDLLRATASNGSTLVLGSGTWVHRSGVELFTGSSISGDNVRIVNDGTLPAPSKDGLGLFDDSRGTLSNAQITSTGGYGVNVHANSELTLINSQVVGLTGARLAGSVMNLVNTSVVSTGTTGFPIIDAGILVMETATLNMSAGSSVIGITSGISISGALPSQGTSVVMDASTVTATQGPGILLGSIGQTQGDILLTNGSVVSGGDGTAVSLIKGSTANLEVQRSTLQGALSVSENSQATVFLSQGQINGNIIAASASTLDVTATAGTRLTGNVESSAGSTLNLSLVGSVLDGDVTADGTGTSTVQLSGSQLTGNVLNANSVTLADGSVLNGNVASDGVVDTTVQANTSRINGDVSNVSSLTLADGSVLNGNVSSDGVSPMTVALAGSQLNGNATNVNRLSLDASTLNGTVSATGVTTQALLTGSQWVGNATASSGANLHIDLAQTSMNGDISADASSHASLVMSAQSDLTGKVTGVATANLTDSTWQVTGDSSIGALALNDSTVALGENGQFYRLSLASLDGSGTFKLHVDFAQELASFVDVSGQASGDYKLLVSASVEDPAANNALQVVHTGTGSTAQFTLEGGRVDLGTYAYDLVQRGTDWFLDTDTKTIAPEAGTVLALFNTAPTVWYGELSTLRSRMGELRYNDAQPGFWMRAYGNKYNVTTSTDVSYRQTQHGVSFGADAPVPVGDGQWLAGVLGGYSDSSLDLSRGTSGGVDSYYLGTYATWLDRDSGYYFDGVLKFNRFQNSANVSMSDGTRSKGDYDNSAVGTSLEFGRHISFTDGYFVEPYTQLAGVVVSGKDYTLDNGMRAEGSSARSLLGKVGSTVGRTIDLSGGSMVQPYVRAALAHEFASSNRVRINDNSFNNDLSGSRGELGAGVAMSMNERLQLHVDLDYSNGRNIEQPWGANVGLRYSW